ncbi:MAG: IS1182 family transposase [Methylobacter sp.]|nr:IS1182 family transposase [Methylobacter sp.]
MATQFILIDRDTPYILPPCVQDYLPEEHMARFVVEIVDQLDLGTLSAVYAGKGKRPYHPAMLLALLFYGYATGVFSSRKLEKATHDSMAFKYICANENPDHDTINSFRKRFGKEIEGLFVEILVLAEALGLLKLGTVSLDGTKIKANASKHKALSWDYANQLEAQFKQEVDALMKLAEAADNTPLPEDMDVPKELKRRQDRLVVIAKAKQEIQARAKVRYAQEKAEYDEKLAKREKHLSETDKKMGGKVPQAPTDAPQGKDQVSLTDEESRIIPTPNGFEQAYNAQASVDIASHLIVAHHITQHTNDKQEIEPTLTKLGELPKCLGTVGNLLADTGYFSQANVKACADAKINPYIAPKRQSHNQTLEARFQHQPEIDEPPLSPVEAMTHRLTTKAGKALYGKRKSTVETVFGIIKHVQGFRQFHVRGLESVQSEWNLVCIGWNLKRMHVLRG